MNEFDVIKSADASVLRDVTNWENKADDYLRDFFNDDIERVQGTRFGDNIAIILLLKEGLLTDPDTFRGVRDKQGRLQAGAIVQSDIDYLSVEYISTAPWNIVPSQPESIKGAGTSLMEEIITESMELGFEGRLRLTPIQRSVQFYRNIGFTESEDKAGELKLTPEAARRFVERQERFRRTGRQ